MGKVNAASAPTVEEAEGYEGRFGEVDGYSIGFETYSADGDMRDLFKGLPNDQCQAPHWGYVLEGKITYHTADGTEVFEAGDAYYVGPGHTPEIHAGGRVVEFSPSDELAKTMEAITKNMEAMEG